MFELWEQSCFRLFSGRLFITASGSTLTHKHKIPSLSSFLQNGQRIPFLSLPSHPASTYLTSNGEGLYLSSPNCECKTRIIAKHVSKPIKSAKVNGPIGMLHPSFIVA